MKALLRVRLARLLVLALAASVSAATTVVAGEPPPCFAVVSLDPDHAVVGEPVLYRVRVARRPDVISAVLDPPNFSALRAEWLLGRSDSTVTRDGVAYRIREEHIALVASAPALLTLGPAAVRCTSLHEDARQTTRTEVPAVKLTIHPLPAKGQPAAFAGLVGEPSLVVTITPRHVSLGETVRVAVLMRGHGNLWDARDPLPPLENAEVFRLRPVLRVDRGAKLSIARHFIYDVVPRKEGDLVVPEIVVPYFDPVTATYAQAKASGATVKVAPRSK